MDHTTWKHVCLLLPVPLHRIFDLTCVGLFISAPGVHIPVPAFRFKRAHLNENKHTIETFLIDYIEFTWYLFNSLAVSRSQMKVSLGVIGTGLVQGTTSLAQIDAAGYEKIKNKINQCKLVQAGTTD